jgi:adenosylhomocysteine nucleosidase
MTKTAGILFATKMEADSFLEQTRPDHCIVTVSGMGMEAACSATRRLIEEQGVTHIVNAGICGALDGTLVRGSVFFVSKVWTEDQCDNVSLQHRPNAKRLVTVNEPVFQTDRKEKLAAFADLVDMEGFVIARLCQEHNIPCVLIKGITDFGDPQGKADIKKHITSVSEKVTETLRQSLSLFGQSNCQNVVER